MSDGPSVVADAETSSSASLDRTRVHTQAARALELFERFGLLVLFGVVVLVFSLLRPETFATSANWQSIATTQSVSIVLAIALLPPLICGRFDVSSGANMAACAIAAAAVMSKTSLPLAMAILAAVALGLSIGLFNGVVVAYLGVNSIVATLAVSTIITGLVTAYTKGVAISNGISTDLTDLSIQTFLGVPLLLIIALVFAVAGWYVFTQTVYGTELTAVGVNLGAARLTGLPVKPLVLSSFVLGGALAGVAGVLLVAQQGSGNPAAASLTAVLPALAAAFLGATTWRPGEYNVQGTVLALFFIGSTTSGLTLIGTAPWVTDVFNGAAVIVAVVIAGQIRRRRVGALEVGD